MMLIPDLPAQDESGHPTVHAIAVAALVVLAGRLPGHPESGRDLWPSDAQIDGLVDEHREFRLCLVSREPGVLDLLKHLRCSHMGKPLRRVPRFCWRLLPPSQLRVLDSRTRPALRLAHEFQNAAEV